MFFNASVLSLPNQTKLQYISSSGNKTLRRRLQFCQLFKTKQLLYKAVLYSFPYTILQCLKIYNVNVGQFKNTVIPGKKNMLHLP